MKRETWKAIIQVVITILTAISSTVLVQSCGLLH
ncbi:MAG: smalltalk protein [Prevotella sp.]|nr:smalltalk protein [Prevotella sp.]